jgi:predicted nucleic acid-binding protein
LIRYFDSSAVLARLLVQEPDPVVAELWGSASERLASSLLVVECLIGIRRAAAHRRIQWDDPWVRSRIAAAERTFEEVTFKALDRSIEEIVRNTPSLAECRTLDAIHVATALHFRPSAEGPFEVVTLDKGMKNVARRLGLTVSPA